MHGAKDGRFVGHGVECDDDGVGEVLEVPFALAVGRYSQQPTDDGHRVACGNVGHEVAFTFCCEFSEDFVHEPGHERLDRAYRAATQCFKGQLPGSRVLGAFHGQEVRFAHAHHRVVPRFGWGRDVFFPVHVVG